MRDLLFLPSFSLDTQKVTSYNSVFVRNKSNNTIKSIHEFKTKRTIISNDKLSNNSNNLLHLANNNRVVRSNHKFEISDNAYRTLKRKINWLYYLAKSKKVKTYNGKDIYNFKIGFITLTLPSKQKHSTSDITKLLLNPFLTQIRTITKMENYVWRLEFQKNGNVHYHLVTDTYIDYHLVRRIWNKLLKKEGYIEDYQTKMSKLSLSDYINLYSKNSKLEYSEHVKNYAKNKRENWENPPSVDVKSVISNQTIANYISKYFAKTSDENPIKNEHDTDENSSNIRLWFCSRSLSKLNTISNFCEAVEYDIFAIVSYCSKIKKVIGKYATSIYFSIKDFEGHSRKWIELILKKYANDNNYIPSS